MSFYISNRQTSEAMARNTPQVPVLLERPETGLQHRIYPEEFDLSFLMVDSYELTNRDRVTLYYPIIPGPCPSLFFKFNQNTASGGFCGMTTALKKISLPPQHTLFCVRLQPGTAGYLSNHSAKLLTNSCLSIENYFCRTALLLNQLRTGESFHERNVRIHQYIKALMADSSWRPMPIIKLCFDYMKEAGGDIQVSKLAELVGCSDRYLCRVFQEHVGSSLKLCCEIEKMQHSLNDILTTRPKSLIQVALRHGYFDQPHMNRAYQKLLGRTASDMRFFDETSCYTNSIPIIF